MKPNFLIFCTDEMQSYCLGCNGHSDVRTPNIDALAADGVNFQRGYCNNTVCMPSRATLVTGLTPRQHGLLTNGNILPENVPTATQALVDNGYTTYAAGKLHLQPGGGEHSLERGESWQNGTIEDLPKPYYGFQNVDLMTSHGAPKQTYRRWLLEHHPEYADTKKQDMPVELHFNNWVADRTIDALDNADDQPFFIWCSFPDPHMPFEACEPYRSMYDPNEIQLPPTWNVREENCEFLEESRATDRFTKPLSEEYIRRCAAQTYGMITHVDDCVGRVIETLKKNGQYENTVIVLLADHGEYLGTHNLMHKDVWPYEELARVPFIWKGTAGQAKDIASQQVVSLLDFIPTVLDYAGIDLTELDTRGVGKGPRLGLPGRSLLPLVQDGEELEPRPALIEYDEDFWPAPLCRQRTIVDGDLKMILWGGYEADGLLFNLAEDPHELHNLWSDPAMQSAKSDLMQKLLHMLTMSDRFDTERLCGA